MIYTNQLVLQKYKRMLVKKPIIKLAPSETRLGAEPKKKKEPKKLTFKTEQETERKVLSLIRDGKKFSVVGRKTIIIP